MLQHNFGIQGKFPLTISEGTLKIKRILVASLTLILSMSLMSPAAANEAVFYLDLSKGCYSYTKNGKGTFPIESTRYKNLFKTSCNKPHHVEVFFAGNVKTKNNAMLPTQEDVQKVCVAKYKKKFGKEAPRQIVSNTPYLRWFFADAGAENRKYGTKGICFAHLADSTYSNYISVNKSFK